MIQIHTFKNKEKEKNEGRLQLGGQQKVPSLVALIMFHVWWLMEGSNAWWPLECFHVWW
jgi:hypothetical protein